MLFDDDYNTYEETPFVTVEAASEQLLTGVLSNIHEFEMGLVLEEYQYLAEHGYEMALSEAEWWDQFKDNVKDLWQNAVRKIKEYFRNFAGWCAEMYDRAMKWLRTIGMTKDSASKAISAYNARQKTNNPDEYKKIAKVNGVLLVDMNQLVNGLRSLYFGKMAEKWVTVNKGTKYRTQRLNGEKNTKGLSGKYTGDTDNMGMVRNILEELDLRQFSGRTNDKISIQVKAVEFEISKEAAQESFNLLFQYKNVVRSIKQMESDLISRVEKELNSYRSKNSSRAPGLFSDASQDAKDKYRDTVEALKLTIRFASTAASTAIHMYKSSISTAIMVMRKIFAFNRDNNVNTENKEYARMTANASAIQDDMGLLALYDSMD